MHPDTKLYIHPAKIKTKGPISDEEFQEWKQQSIFLLGNTPLNDIPIRINHQKDEVETKAKHVRIDYYLPEEGGFKVLLSTSICEIQLYRGSNSQLALCHYNYLVEKKEVPSSELVREWEELYI